MNVEHNKTIKLFWALIKAVRPRQWIKNFALFAGLIFSGQLDNPQSILSVFYAFTIFCGATSATYLLNDVFDVERDRLHPFKSKRPIAAGLISTKLAIALALIIIAIIIPISYQLSPALFLGIITYLILQLFYSSYLKSVILLDVMAIAAGFVLRVYAGVWVIDAHLNVWFLLAVISFALFLAIGKRRSELTLLHAQASKHRETLLHYPENLLDILTAMFANSTWLSYALFTFLQPPIFAQPRFNFFFDAFPLPFAKAKYLMATVPVVIYGVMRYLYIIYEKKEGESPERVLLTDRPLLTTVVLWLVMVIGIIYYLGA
ncbi:decaprenyl-phosphate phosphoribosyltransferase [Candidatus Daviesbacteria bacterium]|nr:decaprenyl-phosphate phosphoribosyltransferase [Candidatus Daviesbacteria bacterium]